MSISAGVSRIQSVTKTVPVLFTDEEGNPLPSEALVAFWNIGDNPNALPVTSTYIGSNSEVMVPLTVGNSYRVRLYGNRVPNTTAFVTDVTLDGTTVVIQNYISPVLSQAGFQESIRRSLPSGWFNPADENVATITGMIADICENLQQQLSVVTSSQRLLSSTGIAIDSWASDFFGDTLPRYRNEPDMDYIARVESELSSDNCTLLSIATKTRAFLVLQASYNLQQVFALDTSGSIDIFGGLDDAGTVQAVPTVTAFDRQSDPTRSAILGLDPGDICLLFSYPGLTKTGFFAGKSFLGYSSFLLNNSTRIVGSPSEAISNYVNGVKALGTRIVYADNRV